MISLSPSFLRLWTPLSCRATGSFYLWRSSSTLSPSPPAPPHLALVPKTPWPSTAHSSPRICSRTAATAPRWMTPPFSPRAVYLGFISVVVILSSLQWGSVKVIGYVGADHTQAEWSHIKKHKVSTYNIVKCLLVPKATVFLHPLWYFNKGLLLKCFLFFFFL